MENIDQPTGVEFDPIAQMESLLGGSEEEENTDVEEEVEEESEPSESEDAIEETEDEVAEPTEEYEEIQWNGETKKLTKTELKELAQKGFDYTAKTQELSRAKQDFESQVKAVQETIAVQNQQIEVIASIKAIDGQLERFKQVNWQQLASDDPVEYLKLNQSYQELKDARNGMVSQYQQNAQQQQMMQTQAMQQTLARESKLLAEAIPEFRGEKAKDAQETVKKYLAEIGFSEGEISTVMDHRAVRVAYEAAQWRALQKAKPAMQKKAAELPKIVKPGANKSPSGEKVKREQLYGQLRKTGSKDAAAKLVESLLK